VDLSEFVQPADGIRDSLQVELDAAVDDALASQAGALFEQRHYSDVGCDHLVLTADSGTQVLSLSCTRQPAL
jgi:hypothetical protein